MDATAHTHCKQTLVIEHVTTVECEYKSCSAARVMGGHGSDGSTRCGCAGQAVNK